MTDTTQEVTTRREHGKIYPTINVKVYDYVDIADLEDELYISEEQAREVAQKCFDIAQETFWQYDAPSIAWNIYGDKAEIFSAGRMGGWLILDGLHSPEYWEDSQMEKWRRFKKLINETIENYKSLDYVTDCIMANNLLEGENIEITNELRSISAEEFLPIYISLPESDKIALSETLKLGLIRAIDEHGFPSEDIFTNVFQLKEISPHFFEGQRLSKTVTNVEGYGLFVIHSHTHNKVDRYRLYFCGQDREIIGLTGYDDIAEQEKAEDICKHLSKLLFYVHMIS